MDAGTGFKSGYAAIIGRPNVGKSTLMNALIGQKIAITSSKPQTTRERIRTVYTCDEGQIIFLDTPGMHRAKNKLGEYMMSAAKGTLGDADVILWLVEPDSTIGPGDKKIAEELKNVNVPVILVINKVDTIRQDDIFEVIAGFKALHDFAEIIPASALKGVNTSLIIEMIFKYLPYGPMYYDRDTVTDQSERQIIAEIIREKALRALKDEVPHGIAVVIERMQEREKITDIEAVIICEKESHKGIVIGSGGAMIKKIGSAARYEIERMLSKKVNLRLFVKVKKEWRRSGSLLKDLGYGQDGRGNGAD